MKKIVALVCALFIFGSFSVFSNDSVGIGFEFGTNYVVDLDGDTGSSHMFILNFSLAENLKIGYYHENIDGPAPFVATDVNGIQVTTKIINILESGVRFGSANNTVYGGIFASLIPISRESDTFHGDIRINLGFDFIPNQINLFKVGISSSIGY